MNHLPVFYTRDLDDAFERFVAVLFVRNGNRYRWAGTHAEVSSAQFAEIRAEVFANATVDDTSLAYQMLLRSIVDGHLLDPCPTCDAAIRLAWGASHTRRTLGLPASNDMAADIAEHSVSG